MVSPSISKLVVAATIGFAATRFVAAGSTSEAASKPASTPASTQSTGGRLPDSFAIFQAVNPFSAKHHLGSAATTQKGGPEATIILSGVAQAGSGTSGEWTAFFDSGKGNPVLMLSVGDAVARGHIQCADLDSITYVCGEQSQHVEVGQNLNGETPPPTSQPDQAHKTGDPPTGDSTNMQPSNVPPSDGPSPQNPPPPNQNN